MMIKLMIAGVTLLVMLSGLSTIDLVFADVYEIRILEGSSIEGCEKTNSCLNPSELTILKGDTVNWIREEDTSHFIQSYTDSQLNWATLDYTHTFNRAGIFHYTISEMPWIEGVINVKYTQNQNDVPNSINFVSVKKIDDSLHLEYEGHIDTEGGKMMIYTDANQRVGNFGVAPDNDGYFSTVWIDFDDKYHVWVDGIYRVEFWSVDGDNGNKKSDIIETSFSLNSQTELISETEPELDVELELDVIIQQKIPEWVRNIFIWYAEDRISEDDLIGALQFLIEQGIIKV